MFILYEKDPLLPGGLVIQTHCVQCGSSDTLVYCCYTKNIPLKIN